MAPAMRVLGPMPGLPERLPFSWTDIDAYEVLFDTLACGGLPPGWSPRAIVDAIPRLFEHLAQAGLVEPAIRARMRREFRLWAPRAIEHYEHGVWYERDGTRHRP
jgi:hypothetical protein